MKKVISFCLWGNSAIYNSGLLQNIELAKQYYPDWICYVYIHIPSVPDIIKEELKKHNNVELFPIERKEIKPKRFMLYRFHVADDENVERFICRDTDSRISPREVLAVREWITSGKTLHIMRDHPRHYPKILGGMFGLIRKNIINAKSVPTWAEEIDLFYSYTNPNLPEVDDQVFLENGIYSRYASDSIIHDEIMGYETTAKNFHIPYERNGHFTGCYVDPVTGESEKITASILHSWLRTFKPERISNSNNTYEQMLLFLKEKVHNIVTTNKNFLYNSLLDLFVSNIIEIEQKDIELDIRNIPKDENLPPIPITRLYKLELLKKYNNCIFVFDTLQPAQVVGLYNTVQRLSNEFRFKSEYDFCMSDNPVLVEK